MINLVGVLPVSALNIGVVAALPVLSQQVAQLNLQIQDLNAAFAAQVQFDFSEPPNMLTMFTNIAVQKAGLPKLLLPTNVITCSASFNQKITAQLVVFNAQLTALESLVTTFTSGLNAGSLALWTYAGNAKGFGSSLAVQTATGYGSVTGDKNINALIIATESQPSWQTFSKVFNTGSSSVRRSATNQQTLQFEGVYNGGQLNTGLVSLTTPINLYLDWLRGKVSNCQSNLATTLAVNLPSVSTLSAQLNFSFSEIVSLLQNLVGIKANLGLEISRLNLRIQALLDLIGSFQITLEAGGLVFWSYSGPASNLGSDLKSVIYTGIPYGSGPDAPIYGLVVASELPTAWASFGTIFKVT